MRIRGFKLCRPVINLRRWISRRKSHSNYHRLPPSVAKPTAKSRIEKFFNWDRLKSKAKRIGFIKPRYTEMGRGEPVEKIPVPKGHLAVYVGKQNGEFSSVVVPVIYFNHPLFGDLLREAEEEFGFSNSGRITIPCRISEFEKVKTSIAAGRSCRSLLNWKSVL